MSLDFSNQNIEDINKLEKYNDLLSKLKEMCMCWDGIMPHFAGGMQGGELPHIYKFFKNLNSVELEMVSNNKQLMDAIDQLYAVHLNRNNKDVYYHFSLLSREMFAKSSIVSKMIENLKQFGIGDNKKEKAFFSGKINFYEKISECISIHIDPVFVPFLEDLRKSPLGIETYKNLIKKYFGSLEQMVNYRDSNGNNLFAYGLIYKNGINAERLGNIISYFDGEPYTVTKISRRSYPILASERYIGGAIEGAKSKIVGYKHKTYEEEKTLYIDLKAACFEKNYVGISAFDLMRITPTLLFR